jgi:ADP-ribose pyrophosphatase
VKKDALIVSRRRLLNRFLKVDEIAFRRIADDDRPLDIEKSLLMERGDSAAGLVNDIERDVVVLVRQFRIAVFARRTQGQRDGAIIELPAGTVEREEAPEQTIRREVLEEVGYQAQDIDPIMTVFVSPGGTSERVYLFYIPVTAESLVNAAARGVGSEEIERVEMPSADFMAACASGELEDAKTVLAGFWLRGQR